MKGKIKKRITKVYRQNIMCIQYIKKELRQSFLDSMNSFSRFSVGLVKHCAKFNNKDI